VSNSTVTVFGIDLRIADIDDDMPGAWIYLEDLRRLIGFKGSCEDLRNGLEDSYDEVVSWEDKNGTIYVSFYVLRDVSQWALLFSKCDIPSGYGEI
jgi:hypothetical protein